MAYTLADASSVLWENLKTLKAWTPKFVKQRSQNKLSPAQIAAYSQLLNATSDLRNLIVNKLDNTSETRKATEKVVGKPWHVFYAEMQAAFTDLGKALAGTGKGPGLGDFGITLAIIAVIAISAALATASVMYKLSIDKQEESKVKIAELANSTALAIMDCKKSGKCSEAEAKAMMEPLKILAESTTKPSMSEDIKDAIKWIAIGGVVLLGLVYAPAIIKIVLPKKAVVA